MVKTITTDSAVQGGGTVLNHVRLAGLTYPDGRVITGGYGTAGGMNDWLNRIADLSDPSATLAAYTYLGLWTVVRIDYPQPSVRLDLWGGVSGIFDGFDRFSRIIDQRWQNDVSGTPTDIDRYQYGYDRNSNRIWKRNTVGSALDEFYTYDRLNRLNQMQRGTLTGTPPTGITGTPIKEQDWTLDPVGNWSAFINKTAGTTDLNQTRTHSTVNEITGIGGTPAWATPPAYDAAGNMTSFPQPATPANAFGAVYDAWNRLTKVTDGANTVAEYAYDGFGRRIVKKTYTGGTLTETRHVYYTAQWQNIEERVGTSTTADRQQVWGIRYADELICRDDATPQRLYALQDANCNVTSITDNSGVIVERYVFGPYGVRNVYGPSWSIIVGSSYQWEVAFQGLHLDPETDLIYARFRLCHPVLGAYLQRDPLVQPVNLYLLLDANPLTFLDPYGLYPSEAAPAIPGVILGARGAIALLAAIKIAWWTPWVLAALLAALIAWKLYCDYLYRVYEEVCKRGPKCPGGMKCAEYDEPIARLTACVAGREAYIVSGCDIINPTNADHPGQLAQQRQALANCVKKKESACFKELLTCSEEIPEIA